jgi:hypothetical protein
MDSIRTSSKIAGESANWYEKNQTNKTVDYLTLIMDNVLFDGGNYYYLNQACCAF